MDERAPAGFGRRMRLIAAAMASTVLGGSIVLAGPATVATAAPTPVVSVTPSTGADAAGQVLAVSGSNVSTTANGGIGIYVAFGPDPDTLPADKWVNAAYYQNVAWTHPGGTGTATNKNLEPDGTFSYNLTRADGSPLAAVYTTSTGTYDCTQISCGILTFTAHGVPDRTQDTFTPVSFAPVVTTASLPFTNRTQAYSQTLTAVGGTAPHTWSLASGTLPTGLSLSSAGVISGSTTAAAPAGTSSFTVQVTDSSSVPVSATQPLSILVKTPSVVVTPSTSANPDGQTFTVTGSGFNPNAPVPGSPSGTGVYVAFGPDPSLLPASPPFNVNQGYYQAFLWARLAPPGITDGQKEMNADGTFSFTFTSGGSPRLLTAQYTAASGSYDCAAIQCGVSTFRSQGNADRSQDTFTPVTFASPISVTTTTLPFTNRTQAYSQTLAADGGTAPYTWSIASGALPAGLTLSSAGVISGSTTAAVTAGTYEFTVLVTDSSPSPLSTTQPLSILVKTPTVTVVPATNANPNGQTFTVTGSGFNPNAPVPGSPTGTGSYVAFGPDPALLPASPAFYAGTSYYQVAVWARLNPASITDGQKAMNADGTFSFTFTTAGSPRALTAVYTSPSGTYDCKAIQCGILTFRSQGNADRSQDTFTPVSFAGPLGVTTASLPGGTVGVGYSSSVASSGGVAPVSWSLASGTLPAGLSLNSATGVISGVPTTAATSSFTVRAADSSAAPQTVDKPLTITVAPTANPAVAKVGVPYSTSVAAFAGVGPYTWSVATGALPPGLTLNPATGVIKGTPNAEGNFKVTVRVTDSKRPKPVKKNTKLQIAVAPVAITIGPSSLPNGKVGVAYSRTLTGSGGVGPYKFKKSSGTLPTGVTLKPTGVLAGTPKKAGTYSFVAQVTDKFKYTSTRSYTVVVTP